ncbi:DUF6491 family protein [Allosphingosinicella sp.]|jgi:hypothetical protein|uniref:DUF6491 family protein n=1 Tax=Allosphingosinicella sp. TaxID=2823234 RepID=UPI002F0C7327
MKTIFLSFAAASALAAPAAAKPQPGTEPEARISFFNLSHFREFHAVDQDTIYVRIRPRQWYRVTTLGPCPGLPWAHAIGVDTRGTSSFDRFSTLIVNGDRCGVSSVVRSDPPPSRPPRKRG